MSALRRAAQQALEALGSLLYPQPRQMAAIAALRAALAEQDNGGKTGWPPGLLQDDSRGLSKWLAHRPDAKRRVREALADGDNLSPTGCDHCRHPLYAATKCNNCGMVTG